MTRDNESQQQQPARTDSPKPGSDPQAAQSIGGKNDFGVPERRTHDRNYTSRNTKASDPGAAKPRSGAEGGRVSGAGGDAVGPGSSSGGDIDTDIVGVGTGGSGVSASGKIHEPPGPDDSTGTSDEFASGSHAQGRNQKNVHKVGGSHAVQGDTVDHSGGGAETNPTGQGADAATNPGARGEDSFSGEISSGEAGGQGG